MRNVIAGVMVAAACLAGNSAEAGYCGAASYRCCPQPCQQTCCYTSYKIERQECMRTVRRVVYEPEKYVVNRTVYKP
ncbi:MAG TPA: hypothetical protein VLA12_19275, partial [Planctomycetaceae bacterium]|nr:hypothetical protein [Planctomycetaceae bacterium]